MSKNKNITNEKLADMMESGFEHILNKLEKTATKAELSDVSKRLDSMVTKAEMNRRFDGLEDRVLASHQKRIEKLEAEIKELREVVA